VGSSLPARIVNCARVAYQTLVDIHFLAIKVGHTEVNAHIGVDMVGGASAIPDTVRVGDAQAAVFGFDRGVVIGKAHACFPSRVDIPGTADGVASRVFELFIFLQTYAAFALRAGCFQLFKCTPVCPVDGVVDGKLLIQTVITGKLGLGRQSPMCPPSNLQF